MLTLKEFITHDKGTYVSAILSDTSKHELGKFVVDNVKNADHVDPIHTTQQSSILDLPYHPQKSTAEKSINMVKS